MYITAQRAFGVSPDRHYRLLHAAGEEKPKIIVLSVIVQEAEGLAAKDANGMWNRMTIYWMLYGPKTLAPSLSWFLAVEEHESRSKIAFRGMITLLRFLIACALRFQSIFPHRNGANANKLSDFFTLDYLPDCALQNYYSIVVYGCCLLDRRRKKTCEASFLIYGSMEVQCSLDFASAFVGSVEAHFPRLTP